MITDRYVVGEMVGAGAFATVYRALDPRLDSPVAIKVLAENWSADPSVCERFGREATLLRRVRSERRSAPLVEVFDIDQTDDGRPFFVMSFADRGTLGARIVDNEAWSNGAVLAVIDTLAEGLHALHGAGIVHRDIKPSNLLYVSQADSPDGEQLLIGDLGLAKDLLTDSTELTLAGGTPRYMAPEQQRANEPVTPGADIYSASVIVCELLSGRRNLDGIDQLPAAVRAELQRGTASNPTSRHESVLDWHDAMTSALVADDARHATNPSPPVEAEGDSRGGRTKLLGLLAAVAALVTLVLGAMLLADDSPDIAIVGQESAEVGETLFLRADVPPGGFHVWTVDGNRVVDQDLRLTPRGLGTLRVRLDYTDSDGATSRVDHEIVVTDAG